MKSFLFLFSLFLFFSLSLAAPPIEEGAKKRARPLHDGIVERMKNIKESLMNKGQDSGKEDEYKRYWEELLANNPDLARRFHDNKPEDIAAKIGDRIAHRNGDVRSQIDELQRRNLEEMRELHREKMRAGNDRVADIDFRNKMREHLSPKELEEKIKEHQRIQEQLDHARRDEFKNYEMKLEHLRRQKMKQMDETHRLKEEERLRKLAEERKVHEPLLHPASKVQLENVWNNEDGLKDETFNARTFFHLHDTNGDGVLDNPEVESLFVREIKKYYGDNYANNMEAREDLARMREHVMSEVDRDRDALISLEEFTRYANTDIFNVNEEWKPIGDKEQHKEFTDEDFKNYEDEYDDDEDYDYDEQGNIIGKKKKVPHDGMPTEHHEMPSHELPNTEHELPPGLPHDMAKGEHGLPNTEHGLPQGLPNTEHGLPHDMAKGEHGLPNTEHGLPQGLPNAEHGLPQGLPNTEHGLPQGLPNTEHGLPHDMAKGEQGLPNTQHGIPNPEHGLPQELPKGEHGLPQHENSQMGGANQEQHPPIVEEKHKEPVAANHADPPNHNEGKL